MQIIEDENHRGQFGDHRHEPDDGLEQQVTLRCGLSSARRVQNPDPVVQFGHQARQVTMITFDVSTQQIIGGVHDGVAAGIGERSIRQRHILVAMAEQHRGAFGVGVPPDFGDKECLADAGLSAKQDDLAAPGRGTGPSPVENCLLGGAAAHHGVAARHQPGWQRWRPGDGYWCLSYVSQHSDRM